MTTIFFFVKRENLTQPIQMQLSKKLKVSSGDFTAFLKSTYLILNNSEKKGEHHSLSICGIIDGKTRAYLNA